MLALSDLADAIFESAKKRIPKWRLKREDCLALAALCLKHAEESPAQALAEQTSRDQHPALFRAIEGARHAAGGLRSKITKLQASIPAGFLTSGGRQDFDHDVGRLLNALANMDGWLASTRAGGREFPHIRLARATLGRLMDILPWAMSPNLPRTPELPKAYNAFISDLVELAGFRGNSIGGEPIAFVTRRQLKAWRDQRRLQFEKQRARLDHREDALEGQSDPPANQ
jgi:hypothetical protein